MSFDNTPTITFTKAEFPELAKTFKAAKEALLEDQFNRAIKFIDDYNAKDKRYFFKLFSYENFNHKPANKYELKSWWKDKAKEMYDVMGMYSCDNFGWSIVDRHYQRIEIMNDFLSIFEGDSSRHPEKYTMSSKFYASILSWLD